MKFRIFAIFTVQYSMNCNHNPISNEFAQCLPRKSRGGKSNCVRVAKARRPKCRYASHAIYCRSASHYCDGRVPFLRPFDQFGEMLLRHCCSRMTKGRWWENSKIRKEKKFLFYPETHSACSTHCSPFQQCRPVKHHRWLSQTRTPTVILAHCKYCTVQHSSDVPSLEEQESMHVHEVGCTFPICCDGPWLPPPDFTVNAVRMRTVLQRVVAGLGSSSLPFGYCRIYIGAL